MGIASKFCQDCYFCPEISLIPSEYRVKESEYLNPTQPACIFKYFPNKKKMVSMGIHFLAWFD